jgi:DNA-binding winged helix-turn-helix (wHTH) protein
MIRMTLPMASRREAEIDGQLEHFSPTAHRLLELLLIRGPRWTLHGDMIEIMYPDPDNEPETAYKSLAQSLTILRQAGVKISNFPGVGYRIRQRGDPPSRPAPPRQKKPRPPAEKRRYELNPPGWILGQPAAYWRDHSPYDQSPPTQDR